MNIAESRGRFRRKGSASKRRGNRWPAQEAKAKFSELIRRARTEGPQIVTLHGRDVVTVNPAETVKPKDTRTGRTLVEAMQAMPYADEVEIVRIRDNSGFRDVDL